MYRDGDVTLGNGKRKERGMICMILIYFFVIFLIFCLFERARRGG